MGTEPSSHKEGKEVHPLTPSKQTQKLRRSEPTPSPTTASEARETSSTPTSPRDGVYQSTRRLESIDYLSVNH